MNDYMENLKKIMKEDQKIFAQKLDLEKLYSISVAEQWIQMNVKNEDEFHRKLSALGNILNEAEFQKAMLLSKEICRPAMFDPEKANAAAACIAKLAQSSVYRESASDAGYRLLDKYKEPRIYKTDAFVTHSAIMMRLYEYLRELENANSIER